MIDDIDRLEDGEIATVFKLVKLAADFSHTAYVLAFDQDVVSKALAKRYADSEGSGSSFIEKIVQVPIELPRADEGILQDITVEAIEKVLGGAAIQLSDDDANRFALVFQRYLVPHIGTPRMVKRIANAIEFVVPLLVGEVNIADLLLLQTMSVLFPSVYRRMPIVKDVLGSEDLARRALLRLRWARQHPQQTYVGRLEIARQADMLTVVDAVLQLHPAWNPHSRSQRPKSTRLPARQ